MRRLANEKLDSRTLRINQDDRDRPIRAIPCKNAAQRQNTASGGDYQIRTNHYAFTAVPVEQKHLQTGLKQACGKNPISVAAVNMIARISFRNQIKDNGHLQNTGLLIKEDLLVRQAGVK